MDQRQYLTALIRKFCRAVERKAGIDALYSENILLLASRSLTMLTGGLSR